MTRNQNALQNKISHLTKGELKNVEFLQWQNKTKNGKKVTAKFHSRDTGVYLSVTVHEASHWIRALTYCYRAPALLMCVDSGERVK